MRYILKLYKYERNRCACDEAEFRFWFDPARSVPKLDESFLGQVKRLFRAWREL